jgi:hypothetical protein
MVLLGGASRRGEGAFGWPRKHFRSQAAILLAYRARKRYGGLVLLTARELL